MVALDTEARRDGHKAMEKQLTAAAHLRRQFKAGPTRRKDRKVSVIEAVGESWILLAEMRAAMRAIGLPEDDVQAALVLLTGDLEDERREKVHVYPVPEIEGLPLLYAKAKKLQDETNVFPLGLVFRQFDRAAERPEVPEVWVQPWLVIPPAALALAIVRERYADIEPVEETVFYQAK